MLTEHVDRDRIRGQLHQRLHCPVSCLHATLRALSPISLISPFQLTSPDTSGAAWLNTTSLSVYGQSTRLGSVVSGYLQSGPYRPQISCNNVGPSPLPLSRQLGGPREQVAHLLNCKDFHKK